MNGRCWYVCVACLMLGMAHPAIAKNLAISIPMSEVSAGVGERGNYYVVRFDLPKELSGKRLDSAFLEFAVDATSSADEVAVLAPVVGVFPLTEESTGSNVAINQNVPTMQPVRAGENRTVSVDIAEIVREWIANPLANYGLVIGTLKGPDMGTISLESDVVAPGAAVRITFFYQNRFGGRVSAQ